MALSAALQAACCCRCRGLKEPRVTQRPAPEAQGERFLRYGSQAGGQCQLLKPAGVTSQVVLKPLNTREDEFYRIAVPDELRSLQPFLPRVYGTKTLSWEQIVDVSDEDVAATQQMQDFPQHYLVMEDLAGNASRPVFLDIKVGCRQRSERHNWEKRQRMAAKAAKTTSAALGFRVCGMHCFDRATGAMRHHNKYEGQKVTVESMGMTLAMYFCLGEDHGQGPLVGISAALVKVVVEKLQKLESVLQLPGKRFWGASLLISFDAGLTEERNAEACLRSVQLKLIDFANFRDVGGDLPDWEYLCGIRNFRAYLEALLHGRFLCGVPADGLVPPPPPEQQDLEQERVWQQWCRLKQE